MSRYSARAGARGGARKKVGLTDEQVEEIREAFNLFDADHSGGPRMRPCGASAAQPSADGVAARMPNAQGPSTTGS